MNARNVIEHATTVWTAAIVIAPKKDGLVRFRVDFKEPNPVSI